MRTARGQTRRPAPRCKGEMVAALIPVPLKRSLLWQARNQPVRPHGPWEAHS